MSTQSASIGKTHLLAYLSDSESAAHIRAVMHRENVTDFVVEPGSVIQATEFLKSHPSPQILIVEVPSAEAAPGLLDALADVVHPSTRVIVTGKIDTLSFYNWLIGLGIHDYLLSPFSEAQLAATLQKLKQPAASAPAKSAAEKHPRHIMAVIGASGGVGTTTLATALAAIGARDFAQATALVDLDLHFGTSALILDLEAGRGLRDALEKPDRIDALFIERLMLRPFSGLSILASEEPLAETIAPHATSGDILLTTLRENYAFIVVDLPRHLDAMSRHVLTSADSIVIVAEPTITSLRDALRLKDYCTDTLKRKNLHVLINREGLNSKQEIPKGEFTKHLGLEPAMRLHYVPEIMSITAQGQLLIDEPKAQAVAAGLRKFLQPLLGKEADEAKPAKGIATFLKGKK